MAKDRLTKCNKWMFQTVKCAKVCYGNNRFRYVPIEDMEIMGGRGVMDIKTGDEYM